MKLKWDAGFRPGVPILQRSEYPPDAAVYHPAFLQMIPLLIGISILVFLLVHLSPGDPIRMLLGEDATDEDVARLNAVYGFDLPPLPVQYFRWLKNALRGGDLGVSIRQTIPVTTLIFERLGGLRLNWPLCPF